MYFGLSESVSLFPGFSGAGDIRVGFQSPKKISEFKG
jgi:hypothetical protein